MSAPHPSHRGPRVEGSRGLPEMSIRIEMRRAAARLGSQTAEARQMTLRVVQWASGSVGRVPDVGAAAPGIVTSLELPLVAGRADPECAS